MILTELSAVSLSPRFQAQLHANPGLSRILRQLLRQRRVQARPQSPASPWLAGRAQLYTHYHSNRLAFSLAFFCCFILTPISKHFTSPSTLIEIRGWTSHAVRGLVHQSPTSSIFYLHAPDVNAGARALLCVLLWHCQKILGFDTGGSLEEVLKADEPGVDCSTELPLEYLFHDVTNYSWLVYHTFIHFLYAC